MKSWYELNKRQQRKLKKEFKHLYPSVGTDALIIIFYIFGILASLLCVGSYAVKAFNSTVSSGIYISVPVLLVAIFFFVIGTVIGLVHNSKMDKDFVNWLRTTKNIIK